MEFIIDNPVDMHLHLRDEAMLKLVAPLSAESFSAAFIMPNLLPPVTDVAALSAYRQRINEAAAGHAFLPLMSLFMRDYSCEELLAAQPHIHGIKLYPAGATTNSEAGVANLANIAGTLEAMQELQIPLMVHGETHGFVMDREKEFLQVYRHLATTYPRLRITMEHITTAEAVSLLDEFENLHATVTLQHLLITLDDVAGGLLRPHLFCKPIAKRPQDREALLACALSGHAKLMFGSDSAPHPRSNKESCGCAAGCFTAPLALAWLTQLFEQHQALDKLNAFVSGNAHAIHGLQVPAKRVVLHKQSWQIPQRYNAFGEEVVPMGAGESLQWSIKQIL